MPEARSIPPTAGTVPAGPTRRQELSAGLLWIVVGLPFFFDYRIPFDLFPDVLGYALLLAGAERLRRHEPLGHPLWWLALVLLPVGIVAVVYPHWIVAAIDALLRAAFLATLLRLGLRLHREAPLPSRRFAVALPLLLVTELALLVLGLLGAWSIGPASAGATIVHAVVVAFAVVATNALARAFAGADATPLVERTPIRTGDRPPHPPPRPLAWPVFGFLLVLYLVLLSFLIRHDYQGYVVIFAYYVLPCAVAMVLLGGVEGRLRPRSRLVVAFAVLATIVAGGLVGGAFDNAVDAIFLYALPVVGVLAITGTGRHRWSGAQILGASMMFMVVWLPIRFSFPSFARVFRASGEVQPIPRSQFYESVLDKFLWDSGIALIGLALFFGTMPGFFARAGRIKESALAYIGAGIRRNWLMDLGLGATTFAIIILSYYVYSALLEPTGAGNVGADYSRVFENVTLDIVFLLSLAAGFSEELIYRALLMTYLERAFRTFARPTPAFVGAWLLQAAAFGLVHAGYQNLQYVLGSMFFGLTLGLVYRFWGFVACVYAHTMYDVVAFAGNLRGRLAWIGDAIYWFIIVHLVLGIAALVLLVVRSMSTRMTGGGSTGAQQQ